MIHRTFRSLDEPPRIVGFSIRQWLSLIAGAAVVAGLVDVAGLPTKPAISLFVFVVGLPAALMYVSESGGLQIGVLLRDACLWRLRPHFYPAAPADPPRVRGVLILRDPRQAPESAQGPAETGLLSGERWS